MGLQSQIKDTLRSSLDADYGMVLQAKRLLLAWMLPPRDLVRWRVVKQLGAVDNDKVYSSFTGLQRFPHLKQATV